MSRCSLVLIKGRGRVGEGPRWWLTYPTWLPPPNMAAPSSNMAAGPSKMATSIRQDTPTQHGCPHMEAAIFAPPDGLQPRIGNDQMPQKRPK